MFRLLWIPGNYKFNCIEVDYSDTDIAREVNTIPHNKTKNIEIFNHLTFYRKYSLLGYTFFLKY